MKKLYLLSLVLVSALATGYSIHSPSPLLNDKPTPLIYAIRTGDVGKTARLLEQGADPNEDHTNNEDGGPLCESLAEPNTKLTELLLQHKANINNRTKSGATLLDHAIVLGTEKHIRLLFTNGVTPFQHDPKKEIEPSNRWRKHVLHDRCYYPHCTYSFKERIDNNKAFVQKERENRTKRGATLLICMLESQKKYMELEPNKEQKDYVTKQIPEVPREIVAAIANEMKKLYVAPEETE